MIVETEEILIIRRIHRQVEIEGEVGAHVAVESKSKQWRRMTMIGKKIKRAVFGLLAVVVCCGSLLAQSKPVKGYAKRHGTITPAEKPSTTGKVTIFSNLFSVPGSVYNPAGFYVSGPDNSTTYPEQWVAIPFTPTADSHVEEMQLAVGIISGTNLMDVTLAVDGGGVPGTALATKTIADIPEAGTCCTLATVRFKAPGIAVNAGTQYWIVATSNEFEPTFTGLWQFSNLDWYSYSQSQSGWASEFTSDWPAAAVSGTVP
jgi:hypothetical protein